MKYYVEVTEVLKKVVSVDAECENQAVKKVKDAYAEGEIVLTEDDYVEDSAEIDTASDQSYYENEEKNGYAEYQHIG